MHADDYQSLVASTECDHRAAAQRINFADTETGSNQWVTRLKFAAMGISQEAGELQNQLLKHFWYGHEWDRANAIEELGDVLWYVAAACRALGVTMSEVMVANIHKLRACYPEKGTHECALEDNRDQVGERLALDEVARRLRAEDDGVNYEDDMLETREYYA